MKLFKGGAQEAQPAAAPATAPAAPAPVAPAAGAPAAAPASEIDAKVAVALDKSVKDIAEKLAKLSSSVEVVREERVQFDEKIGKMEDRMRKLSALAEMISTQYNPFLGSEPPQSTSSIADQQPAAAAKLAADAGRPVPRPMAPATVPAAPPPEAYAPVPDEEPGGPFLTRVDLSFQNSMMLLQWCEMMLKASSRDGLPDLLDYYQALGWISEDVRRLLMTYAKGLQVESDGRGDWRGRVDLHEKSLVFVEKLRPRPR